MTMVHKMVIEQWGEQVTSNPYRGGVNQVVRDNDLEVGLDLSRAHRSFQICHPPVVLQIRAPQSQPQSSVGSLQKWKP